MIQRSSNQTRWRNDSWIGGPWWSCTATICRWFTQHNFFSVAHGSASASVTFDSRKGGLQVERGGLMLRSFMFWKNKKKQQNQENGRSCPNISKAQMRCLRSGKCSLLSQLEQWPTQIGGALEQSHSNG